MNKSEASGMTPAGYLCYYNQLNQLSDIYHKESKP